MIFSTYHTSPFADDPDFSGRARKGLPEFFPKTNPPSCQKTADMVYCKKREEVHYDKQESNGSQKTEKILKEINSGDYKEFFREDGVVAIYKK